MANNNGTTALMKAVSATQDKFREMVQQNYQVYNPTNPDKCVEALLEAGANVNTSDNKYTVLTHAVVKNCEQCY